MDDSAYEKLKSTGTLPTPSGAAMDIMRTASDPNATIDAVVDLVESDAATAARVLQYVNSPFAGLSRQVSSLRTAVTLLGRSTIRCIAIGFSLAGRKTSRCRGFEDQSFWTDSVARGAACRHIVGAADRTRSDELFACGLLCQIGRLAFAGTYPRAYAEVLGDVDPSDSVALAAAETEAFDIDHNTLAADMMHDWGLPPSFCHATRFQDDPAAGQEQMDPQAYEVARILQLAGWTAALLTPRHVPREALSRFVNGANRCGIKPGVIDPVFESVKEEWRALGPVFNLHIPEVPSLATRFVETREA